MNAKTIRKWLILGGLLTAIGIAYADFNVQDKGSYYNNATTGQRTNAQGGLLVDTSPFGAEAQQSDWIQLISDTMAIGASQDSSQIQTSYRGYVLQGLSVRASCEAAAGVGFCRIAISVRTHINDLADSVNTVPVLLYRNAVSVALDSLAYGKNVAGSAVAPDEYEFIVTLYRQATGSTKYIQRYVPLSDAIGNALRLKNFSVKARVLSATVNTNSVVINGLATQLR